MKWFCYLFSFYILLLSGLPCTDGNCDQLEQRTQGNPSTSMVAASHSGIPQKHDFDSCSPLCTCQRCATHYTVCSLSILIFKKVVLASKKAAFLALVCRVNDVVLAIDRPPQLV